MAYVKDNPITSKWHGQVAGHQYRVVRGKQVIASVVSSMGNKNAPKRKRARGDFASATKFTGLWLPVVKANLRKVENDAFKVRGLICSAAMATFEDKKGKPLTKEKAEVNLEMFVRKLNEKSGRYASAELRVVLNENRRVISAPAREVVVYETVARGEEGVFLGRRTTVFVSDGEERALEVPVVRRGEVEKYEVMAFDVTLCNGAVWKGPVGDVEGKATKRDRNNSYNRLLEALMAKGCRIKGLVSG